jgi:signal peptidase I
MKILLRREVLVTAAVAILCITLIGVLTGGILRVSSGSMKNTIWTGDYVIVSRLRPLFPRSWRRSLKLARGEIVIFQFRPNEYAIKRIIGVAKDTFQLYHGVVTINGQQLPEPYIRHDVGYVPQRDNWPLGRNEPVTIPSDKYFLMGDNRDRSSDSRLIGLVSEADIVGTVLWVLHFSRSQKQVGTPSDWPAVTQ